MIIDIDDDFLDAFKIEDDLGIVIRSHIYIEKQLMDFNRLFVKEPKFLEDATPFYNHIVNLALAFGLSSTFKVPLNKLGNIRNRFGHYASAALDKALVDDFYRCFSKGMQMSLRETLFNDKEFSASTLSGDISKWPPRQKFAVLICVLHAYLRLAISSGSGEVAEE